MPITRKLSRTTAERVKRDPEFRRGLVEEARAEWQNGEAATAQVLLRAVHPGAILQHELEELGITPAAFARLIDVPASRVEQIIAGKDSITGDTALRFGHWFGTDPQFWLNLQAQWEVAAAEQEAGEAIRQLPTKDNLPPQDG